MTHEHPQPSATRAPRQTSRTPIDREIHAQAESGNHLLVLGRKSGLDRKEKR